jgi:hypothetical protein
MAGDRLALLSFNENLNFFDFWKIEGEGINDRIEGHHLG